MIGKKLRLRHIINTMSNHPSPYHLSCSSALARCAAYWSYPGSQWRLEFHPFDPPAACLLVPRTTRTLPPPQAKPVPKPNEAAHPKALFHLAEKWSHSWCRAVPPVITFTPLYCTVAWTKYLPMETQDRMAYIGLCCKSKNHISKACAPESNSTVVVDFHPGDWKWRRMQSVWWEAGDDDRTI